MAGCCGASTSARTNGLKIARMEMHTNELKDVLLQTARPPSALVRAPDAQGAARARKTQARRVVPDVASPGQRNAHPRTIGACRIGFRGFPRRRGRLRRDAAVAEVVRARRPRGGGAQADGISEARAGHESARRACPHRSAGLANPHRRFKPDAACGSEEDAHAAGSNAQRAAARWCSSNLHSVCSATLRSRSNLSTW